MINYITVFITKLYLTLTMFRSRADLTLLPGASQPQELPGAGHPAYLDQPMLWHQLLHNFLVTSEDKVEDAIISDGGASRLHRSMSVQNKSGYKNLLLARERSLTLPSQFKDL